MREFLPVKEGPATTAFEQAVELAFRFLWIVACALGLGWSVSNVRQVPPDSQAVVLRLGSVVRQQTAGLLLAWPAPIERVVLLPAEARQLQLHIERFDPAYGDIAQASSNAIFDLSSDPRESIGFLLTGDASVVHLQATIYYQIVDPAAYMIESAHIRPALERLFIASAVSVCAGRNLDSILVARPEIATRPGELAMRERLRADTMRSINRRFDALSAHGAGLGVRVTRVDLSAAIPGAAKKAFDEVLTTKQSAETGIAKARTDAQLRAQQANQDRGRVLTETTAQAQEMVTRATARTASIAALSAEAGRSSRSMLLQRLYFDRIGRVLAKAGNVEAVDPEGSVRTILRGSPP